MTGKTAEILNIEEARAKRQDFATSTGFDTAGAYLKGVREAKGFTIEDITERTHIRETHIDGIESGDLSILPARAYLSGFVKTYAEFLELDAGPIVTRFKEDVGLLEPVNVDAAKFEAAEALADSEKREMSLWAVLAVLGFILWSAWQILTSGEVDTVSETPAGFPPPPIAQNVSAILDPLAEPSNTYADQSDLLARVTERVSPVYPRFCEQRAKPEESVEATFNISAEGRVAGARILSSTNACFERAGLNALRRWRFEPRMVDGIARPSWDQVVTLTFKKPA